MAEITEISWCDATFNPWWGCTKVSPACGLPVKGHESEKHGECYALTFSNRLGFKIWGQDAPRRFFGDAHWDEPLKWNRKAAKLNKRLRVFCGSMCDVMEEREGLYEHRLRLYELISSTPWLDWMLLTKRPQNYRRFLPESWIERPLNRVWCGTTVELPEYLWRVDSIKGCGAAIKWLSIEPLLGDLPTLGEYLDGINYVIGGGESGPGSRPMHPDWIRGVRDQCISKGVPFHFKQWGQWAPCGPISIDSEFFGGKAVESASGGMASLKHGVDSGRFVDLGHDVVMERMRQKVVTRELDGEEWNQPPAWPAA